MLRIVAYDGTNNYRTLTHSDQVFHKALRAVLNGEKNFHVTGASEKYDLVYEENNDLYFRGTNLAQNSLFAGETVIPPYFQYDENDVSRLYLELLDGYENIVFEEANEYTVTLARVLLKMTSKQIWFLDGRVRMFLPETDRFHIGCEPADAATEMRVSEQRGTPTYTLSHERIQSFVLFHNVFLLQWICGDLPLQSIRYAEIYVKKTEGIGGLLQYCVRCSSLFSKLGIKTVFRSGSSRFADSMLEKYFNIQTTPADSDESNTIYVVNYIATALTHYFLHRKVEMSYEILNPAFLQELEEYAEAVLGERHMLGVLLRGTDYNMMMSKDAKTPFLPVSAERMIPEIQKRIDRYGYEGIFLATEDRDTLRIIREAFPGKVRAVAQERRTLSEFSPGRTISDIEKDLYAPDEYDTRVSDTTINYFYALYLLSRCEGFLASSMCSGVNMVRAFNGGKFECDDIVREQILKGEIPETVPDCN